VDKCPGRTGRPAREWKTPKLPDQLIAEICGFVGASGSRDPAKQRQTPKLPHVLSPFCAVFSPGRLEAPGRAPGFRHGALADFRQNKKRQEGS